MPHYTEDTPTLPTEPQPPADGDGAAGMGTVAATPTNFVEDKFLLLLRRGTTGQPAKFIFLAGFNFSSFPTQLAHAAHSIA